MTTEGGPRVVVRAAGARAAPGTPAPSGRPSPPQARQGRGRLLAKERWEDRDSRRRLATMLTPFWRAYLALLAGLIAGIVLAFTIQPHGGALLFGLVLALGGVLFMSVLVVPAFGKVPRIVTSVYENGVEVEGLLAGTSFIPWSEFGFWEQVRYSDRPTVLQLNTSKLRVRLLGTMPRFEEVAALAKGTIGVPDIERATMAVALLEEMMPEEKRDASLGPFLVGKAEEAKSIVEASEVEAEASRTRSRKHHLIGFATLCAVVFPIGLYILFGLALGWPHEMRLASYALGSLAVGMFLHSAFTSWFLSRKHIKALGLVLWKWAAVAVISGLAIYGAFTGILWAVTPDIWTIPPLADSEDDPGTSSVVAGTYVNETMRVAGPVAVHDGETLRLEGCRLTFDPAPGPGKGLWVGEGGRLEMVDTIVESADFNTGFGIEVHGSASIVGSVIMNPGDPSLSKRADAGVEVFSSDVAIFGTRFQDANEDALLIYRCSPVVRNCTFINAEDDGILVVEGAPTIEGSNFTGCWIAVEMVSSDARLTGCTFNDNGHGVAVSCCSPRIEGNEFKGSTSSDLEFNADDQPILNNNTSDQGEITITLQPSPRDESYVVMFTAFVCPLMLMGFALWEGWERPGKTEKEFSKMLREIDEQQMRDYVKRTLIPSGEEGEAAGGTPEGAEAPVPDSGDPTMDDPDGRGE